MEVFPMVVLGIRLETQLPATVKARTAAIMIRPLRMSRFLFLPYSAALAALARTSLARAMPTA